MRNQLSVCKNVGILWLVCIASFTTGAQSSDSAVSILYQNQKTAWKKAMTIPVTLITAGLVAITDNDILDRLQIYEARNKLIPSFHTNVDDYLQHAPIVAVYALNGLGIKGEHDFANRTALLIKSEIFMAAMVFPLKKITSVPRPDTGTQNSFPSGHTAQAFAAATFLHKEYGREHPFYSIMAYTTAAGVGVLRVMNNRHWASDVLVGAGIGVLATNLAYLTHQNKWGKNHKKLSGMIVTPTYGQQSLGVYLLIPIH